MLWQARRGWISGRGALDASAAGDAAETTAFLARTSGLSGTETAAYKAMINGMVADGVFAKLDLLYIFATKDTTTANLNLINTSFTLTATGTPTFTADQGYTGSTGNYLSTNYNLSTNGTNMLQSSNSLGIYILTNRTTAQAFVPIGNAFQSFQLAPHYSGNFTYYDTNDGTFPTYSSTTSQGLWVASRTAASGAGASSLYLNGNSTPVGTSTGASVALSNQVVGIIADATGTHASTDQISAAFIGGGLNATDSTNLASRINGYMTALSINVY